MPDVAGLPWPEGDPGGLRSAASSLSKAASGLRTTGSRFVGIARGVDVWSGSASTAYFSGVTQYTSTFSRASSTLTGVAGALNALASKVDDAQDKVRELARKVEAAEQEAREAADRAAALEAAAAAARTTARAMFLDVGSSPIDSHVIAARDRAADATSSANAAAAVAAEKRREADEIRRRAERIANELCRDVEAADRATAAKVRGATISAPGGGVSHPTTGMPSSALGRVVAPRFAPIFRHDSDENNLPGDYRRSINGLNPKLDGGTKVWPLSGLPWPLSLLPWEDRGDEDFPTATLPYLLTRDENGNFEIQYWRWHHRNDHPGAAVPGIPISTGDRGLGDHDGDWEKFSVRFDSDGNPVGAHFSAHNHGINKGWNEIEMEDGHPVVYVTRGAHGSYPESGMHPNSLIPPDVADGGGEVWDTRGDLVDGSTDSRLYDEAEWGDDGSPGGGPPMSPGDPRRSPTPVD